MDNISFMLRYIPYFISLYLFNGAGEICIIAIFDVVLAFLLIDLIQNLIKSQFYKEQV